jgi:mono/diheme cytochrome c family protein
VRGIKEIGTQIIKGGNSLGQRPSLADAGAAGVNLTVDQRRSIQRGESTYKELCFSCHGADGQGAPMQGAPAGSTLAPPLAGSARVNGHREYVIKVLLHGLTGDIEGKTYGTQVMVPMGSNTDEWISDVASYVRIAFGNGAPLVTPAQVAAVRKSTKRPQPWTLAELIATIPTPMTNSAEWKLSASHNPSGAAGIASGTPGARWDPGTPQAPGQWFQIELPEPARVAEVQIESALPFSFGGGRGRGAAPAAGAGRGAAPTGAAPAVTTAPTAAPGTAPATQGAPAAGAPAAAPAAGRGGGRGGPPASGPLGYSVQVSSDGTTWGAPVAQGTGQTPMTTIAFTPVTTKFIRITQTGTAPGTELWGIARVTVLKVDK